MPVENEDNANENEEATESSEFVEICKEIEGWAQIEEENVSSDEVGAQCSQLDEDESSDYYVDGCQSYRGTVVFGTR